MRATRFGAPVGLAVASVLVGLPAVAAQGTDQCVPGNIVGKLLGELGDRTTQDPQPKACVSLTPTSLARSFDIVEDVDIIERPQLLIAQSVQLTTFNGADQAAIGVGESDPCALYSNLEPFVTCDSTELFGPVAVDERTADPVFGELCVYNADLTVTVDGEPIHSNPFAATAAAC